MQSVFLRVLNIAIASSWLVLAALLFRVLFRRAPKALRCAVWGLAALRLLLPFTIESPLSLVPSAETVPEYITYAAEPRITSGISALNSAVNPYISEHFSPRVPVERPEWVPSPAIPNESGLSPEELETLDGILSSTTYPAPNRLFPIAKVASAVWLAGIAMMLVFAAVNYLVLRRRLREAVREVGNIYVCDGVPTPFIIGIFKPRIILPSGISERDRAFALAHEEAHLARLDHIKKPFAYILLAVYWFDPLLWLSYFLFCRDVELACDERVLRESGASIKKEYSSALVNCSAPERIFAGPLAFGESGIKERVKNVLNYKKSTKWVLIFSLIIIAALAVAFLTSPRKNRAADTHNAADKFIDTPLRLLLRSEIFEHNRSDDAYWRFICCDFDVLGTSRDGDRITVYAWAAYSEYSFLGPESNYAAHEESGVRVPVLLTAERSDDASDPNAAAVGYKVIEYWEPRDGFFAKDIRSRFPARLHDAALDHESSARLSSVFNIVAEHRAAAIRELLSEQPELSGAPVTSGAYYERSYGFRTANPLCGLGFFLNSTDMVFQMNYGPLSSYIGFGNFEYRNNGSTLVLHEHGYDELVLNRLGEFWIADRSGAAYIPGNWADTEGFCLGTVSADINGDGKKELCAVGCISLTRSFVLSVSAYDESYLPAYTGMFEMPEYEYSLVETDGRLVLRGVEASGAEHFYEFSLDGVRIRLSEDGEELTPYETYRFNQFC